MKFAGPIQSSYSRLELIIRFLFGGLYIGIPHGFLLAIFGLWGFILAVVSFFSILFKGNYPSALFNYQLQLMRWQLRVKTRLLHLADGYPLFGLEAQDKAVLLEVALPLQTSRLLILVRLFFGGALCRHSPLFYPVLQSTLGINPFFFSLLELSLYQTLPCGMAPLLG